MNTGAKSWVWRQSQAPAAGIKAAGEGGGVCVRGMAAKAGSVSSQGPVGSPGLFLASQPILACLLCASCPPQGHVEGCPHPFCVVLCLGWR